MNHFLRISLAVCLTVFLQKGFAQLTGSGCPGLTTYTNLESNDTVYYYPEGTLGELTATSGAGIPPYNVVWNSYNSVLNAWSQFLTENGVLSSTITNLQPGAYGVTITDSQGDVVLCGYAFIAQYSGDGEYGIDVLPIPPSCISAHLQAIIDYPEVNDGGGAFFNLPPDPMFIDANTEIQICFSGTHTWVSDLAFYAVGPASCGSPTLLLSPNPGAIGQPATCNLGNNISNLCFSSESSANFNICTAATPLTGTYGNYGPGSTPINWSALYGCEATASGWTVQIYDCVGLDVGFLTDATMTFTGSDACGNPQTITYSTPPGFSSAINDNSCSPGTASSFVVPSISASPPIDCEYGFEWNSEPYVYIADSTTSLDFYISLPFINAQGLPFEPVGPVIFTCSLTSSCDSLGYSDEGGEGCLGGVFTASDSEPFSVIPFSTSAILPVNPICLFQPPFAMNASGTLGTWSGNGITDAVAGIFNPVLAGIGQHTISFDPTDPCIYPSSSIVEVVPEAFIFIQPVDALCIDEGSILLSSNADISQWSGPGIVNASSGLFDPNTAGAGLHLITVEDLGLCGGGASIFIQVNALPIVNAGADVDACYDLPLLLAASGAQLYQWSPATYLDLVNSASPVCTPINDITYTVFGTDINGCSNSDEINITVLPEPTVTAEDVSISCPGAPVQLSATGGSVNYQWTPAAGLLNVNTSNATATPSITTTYTVTVTDDCGLQAQAQVVVPVELPVAVNAGSDTEFCETHDVLLIAELVGSYASSLWNSANGTVNVLQQNDLQLLVNDAGQYTITATTELGCVYSDAVSVSEIALPNITLFGPVQLCPMSSVTLAAGDNWDAVLWSTGQTLPTISVNTAGTYSIAVTENGCTDSSSTEVQQIEFTYFDLGPTIEICDGESIELIVPENGLWSTGVVSDMLLVTTENMYEVVVTEGPCSVSDSVYVLVLPLPVAELGNDVLSCLDVPVTLSALHPANDEYEWNTGENGPNIIALESDIYYVVTSNECGEASDSVFVEYEDCTFSIFIPNAFTPDNDGINDVWKCSTYNLKRFDLKIYNRWGDVLFATTDPDEAWTGEADNGEYYVRDGVYFYRIEYESVKGNVGDRVGHITHVR